MTEAPVTETHALVERNLRLLDEAAAVVEQLSDDAYAEAPPLSRQGGVGAQLRHLMDFYSCFVAGAPGGRVDYDRRPREPALEGDRRRALARLRELDSALGDLAELDHDREVLVRADEVEPTTGWSRSTVGRELRFLQSHTVHHFALIRWMLLSRGLDAPEGFGIAPSTSAHWAERGER